jgi:hypothetical protein
MLASPPNYHPASLTQLASAFFDDQLEWAPSSSYVAYVAVP